MKGISVFVSRALLSRQIENFSIKTLNDAYHEFSNRTILYVDVCLQVSAAGSVFLKWRLLLAPLCSTAGKQQDRLMIAKQWRVTETETLTHTKSTMNTDRKLITGIGKHQCHTSKCQSSSLKAKQGIDQSAQS